MFQLTAPADTSPADGTLPTGLPLLQTVSHITIISLL